MISSSITTATVLTVALIFPRAVLGQFDPYVFSVRNSASYADGVAQGSIFVVFGSSMGPAELQQAASYPLALELAGTSVTITSGGRTFPCPIFYAWDRQLAAILPSDTPLGDGIVRVSYQGRTSYDFRVTISASAFGIYTPSAYGTGPGSITGIDYKLKSTKNPARSGEILTIWGTGLGPIAGSDATVPTAENRFPETEVFVGNIRARVEYAGRSGCCAGLDQINFELPASLSGCFVPVAVRSGSITSNFVTVSVDESGQTCSSSVPGLPLDVLDKALAGEDLKYGAIALGPIPILQDLGYSFSNAIAARFSAILGRKVDESDVRNVMAAYKNHKIRLVKSILAKYGVDTKHANSHLLRALRVAVSPDEQGAGAAFGTLHNAGMYGLLFAANFTSVGTCTVTNGFPNMASPRSTALDAGVTLTVSGPIDERVLERATNGEYLAALGSYPDGQLPAGTYTVSSSGGSGVGPFRASISIGSNLNWTNKSAIDVLDRSNPLVVTWSGGPVPGYVLVAGGGRGENFSAGAFLCVEDSRKGTFTVPAYVLAALPPARLGNGMIIVAPHPFSNPISIPGLNFAYIAEANAEYKWVEVR